MAHLLKKHYNMKQVIEFRDPVVQCVVNKFVERSDTGFAKYGKTLRDDKSDLFTWLNHIQEELMDATLYIQRLKEEISDLREERDLRNAIQDLDVVDPETVTSKKKEKKRLKSGNGRGDHYTFTIDEPEHKDWKDVIDQSPLLNFAEFFRPYCATTTMPDAKNK